MESLSVPPILVECYRCGKDDANIGYVPVFRSMHQVDICVALPHCGDCYLELRSMMKTHGQVQEMYGKTRYTYTGNAYAHVLIVVEPCGGSDFATRTQSIDRTRNKDSEHHRHLMAVSDIDVAAIYARQRSTPASHLSEFDKALTLTRRNVKMSLLCGIMLNVLQRSASERGDGSDATLQ